MEISKEELRRALLKNCSEERLAAFENATVAICGLGGLGSNIAVMLARAGIGKLILADFDKVEISNLNRQQYKLSQIGEYKSAALCKNLKEINPFITLEAYTAAITPDNAEEILSCADIICEAFDKAENKAMLTNFVLENMPDKYLVASSGMAGFDRKTGTYPTETTEWNSGRRNIGGIVDIKYSDHIKLEGSDEIFNMNTAETTIAIYDSNENKLTAGSVSDIIDKTTGLPSKLYMRVYYGIPRSVLIIR